jgi:Ca2+-binding RTX toxin-like protein
LAEDEAAAYGGAGADEMTARGDAAASGGDGNDTLTASGDARAYGGAGGDTLFMRGETIGEGFGYGGAGFDQLIVSGRALVSGGGGNDAFIADLNADDASDGEARLTVTDFQPGTEQIAVLLGNRDVDGIEISSRFDTAQNATIVELTEGADGRFASFTLQGVTSFDVNDVVLYGTQIGDVVDWAPAPDGSNETLIGSGNDVVNGGAGNDQISLSDSAVGFGGAGNDTLIAEDDATAWEALARVQHDAREADRALCEDIAAERYRAAEDWRTEARTLRWAGYGLGLAGLVVGLAVGFVGGTVTQ